MKVDFKTSETDCVETAMGFPPVFLIVHIGKMYVSQMRKKVNAQELYRKNIPQKIFFKNFAFF
jgi:hypothetical protein